MNTAVELPTVELPTVELPKAELPNAELPNAAGALEPQQIWKGFHWLFFINIQGLIICLRRLEASLTVGDVSAASAELETATDLMLASGASMELAGSFNRQEYEHHIRPSMMPPQVKSTDFSGLMSWDHASLMEIWKRLRPRFETLPTKLSAQHARFISAYLCMANAHSAVCQKFGGGEAGSLRCDKGTAVRTLEKFTHNRWKLIDPNRRVTGGCPFRAAGLNGES